MSEYKLDLKNFNENEPTPWTDEQYRKAFQSLVIEYHKMKAERDTCLEDIDKLRECEKELEQENEKQLKLLKDFSKFINYKLEIHQSSFIYKNYRAKLDKLGVK